MLYVCLCNSFKVLLRNRSMIIDDASYVLLLSYIIGKYTTECTGNKRNFSHHIRDISNNDHMYVVDIFQFLLKQFTLKQQETKSSPPDETTYLIFIYNSQLSLCPLLIIKCNIPDIMRCRCTHIYTLLPTGCNFKELGFRRPSGAKA